MSHNAARDHRGDRRGTHAGRRRQGWQVRPTLMALEDRRLLSTIVVNNPTDTPVAGQTDLRQAIDRANASGGADTIVFDSTVFKTPQTITLSGTQLELSDTSGTETITGPAAGVTVSGGGLSRVFQIDGSVTASISGMTISGGNTSYSGGGLLNYGTTTLTNCTASGNASIYGGGLYDTHGGTATLTNCTVSGNTAANNGGGLRNYSGRDTLTNCTVSGNIAANNGGGLYNMSGAVTIGNTIVAENIAATSAPDVTGSFASEGNNLIGKTNGSSGWVGSDLTGTVVSPLNPLLAPLGHYGGSTRTMPLLPGCPAIDAGNNSLIPPGVTTD